MPAVTCEGDQRIHAGRDSRNGHHQTLQPPGKDDENRHSLCWYYTRSQRKSREIDAKSVHCDSYRGQVLEEDAPFANREPDCKPICTDLRASPIRSRIRSRNRRGTQDKGGKRATFVT